MKSYTDIEQSKKLVEILPIESADMRYGYIAPYDYSDRMYDGGYDEIPYPKDFLIKNPNFSANEYDAELPCWSLASLLESITKVQQGGIFYNLTYDFILSKWTMNIEADNWRGDVGLHDNPVDACYEMIIKLHEFKML